MPTPSLAPVTAVLTLAFASQYHRQPLVKRTLPVALAASAILSGCIAVVPYPMPKRIESRAPDKQAYDLSFITPGVTPRSEIEQKLAGLSAGANTPGLFWARYIVSTSGMVAAAGAPYAGGGAAAGRNWSGRNLFITFDDAGTVKTTQSLGDSQLDRFFATWFAAHPRSVTLPVSIAVKHWHRDFGTASGELIFDTAEIRYQETSCKQGDKKEGGLIGRAFYHAETCNHVLIFPPADPVRIHGESLPAKKGDDRFTRSFTLGSGKQKAEFDATEPLTPDALLDVISYLQQHRAKVKYQ